MVSVRQELVALMQIIVMVVGTGSIGNAVTLRDPCNLTGSLQPMPMGFVAQD